MRAEEHLHAFRREVALFREIEPYEVTEDRNGDPEALLFTVRARQFPQARWSVIIGDLVHNLRSALDLLANALVYAAGNEPVTEGARKTQFPILKKRPARREGTSPPTTIIAGGVSPEAARILDALQPYTWADDPALHPLAILATLSNKDKHRHLNFILSFIPYVETSIATGDSAASIRHLHVQPVVKEHTFRVPYDESFTRETEMKVHYSPLIIAGERWEGDETEEEDALAFFSYLFEFVCEGVVGRFKRSYFRDYPPLHLAGTLSGRQWRWKASS
jgi:hypothetical protein